MVMGKVFLDRPSPQPSPIMGRETIWMALPMKREMFVRTERVLTSSLYTRPSMRRLPSPITATRL